MKLYDAGLAIVLFTILGFFAGNAIVASEKNDGKLTKAAFVKELQPITPAGKQKYNN